MEKKIGVYICSGCGIGESMDMDALSVTAAEYKAAVCRQDPFLCGTEGVSLIRADMDGRRQRRSDCGLLTAGNDGRFAFPPDKIIERVNLREQVAWSQPAGEEDTLMMAQDALRMGLVRVRDPNRRNLL